ncbi:MAG: SAM-dependent methyltransferase [Carbonactinosporaceae bacterium]
MAHQRALVATDERIATVEGDIRRPLEILADPEFTTVIDLDRPVAVLLVAVLHFVRDEEDPGGVMNYLARHTAPGSYFVITAATSTGTPDATLKEIEEVCHRTRDLPPEHQIRTWFEPFHLVSPGLVDVQHWRPDAAERRTDMRIVADVAYQTGWIG